jgi:hypothetical protein
MRISRIEKTEQLCSGFSQLDGKDQENVFGLLQGLLFAKLKTDPAMMPKDNPTRNAEEKQG